MHKNGHKGVSLLLSSPIIALLLVSDFFVLAVLFIGITTIWSSLPDVDIHLQKCDDFTIRSVPFHLYPMVLISRFALTLHNLSGRFITKVTPRKQSDLEIQHRGITHTLWFGIAFGIILSLISISILVSVIYFLPAEYTTLVMEFIAAPLPAIIIITLFGGICAVLFHCVGDIFTPTGIHILTLRTDYGYTFDQFYAKNKVANRSAFPIGLFACGYGTFVGIFHTEVRPIYLVGGFFGLFVLGIPLWLVFVRTRIGKWFYMVYDFFF